MTSPLEIEIAIHYWTQKDSDFERMEYPAVKEAIETLVREGLLRPCGNELIVKYERTEGLGIWVDALCAVPKPVQRWIVPTKDQEASELEFDRMGAQLYGADGYKRLRLFGSPKPAASRAAKGDA